MLRRRRLWTYLLFLALVGGVAIRGSGSSLLSAVVFALGWTALVAGATLALLYAVTRRRFARQLAAGVALESEFETDTVVLRGPDADSRIRFAGIDRVRVSGEWVLLRQRRSRLTSCWPAALFPPGELAPLQEAAGQTA